MVSHPTGSGEHDIPPPEIAEEQLIYRFNTILDDSWQRGGRLKYFVDWEGYGPQERLWVARDDILDTGLLTEFHALHPEIPAPRGHGCPRRHIVRASGAARGSPAMPYPSAPLTNSQSQNSDVLHLSALIKSQYKATYPSPS